MESDEPKMSEQMVARIVSYLAERGVRRSEFSVDELGFDGSSENHQLFADAIIWLANEDVIHVSEHSIVSGMGQEEVTAVDVSLTSRGYALLAQKFDGALTLGEAVQRSASSGKGYSGVGDFVGGILGGFTKSMGSG